MSAADPFAASAASEALRGVSSLDLPGRLFRGGRVFAQRER